MAGKPEPGLGKTDVDEALELYFCRFDDGRPDEERVILPPDAVKGTDNFDLLSKYFRKIIELVLYNGYELIGKLSGYAPRRLNVGWSNDKGIARITVDGNPKRLYVVRLRDFAQFGEEGRRMLTLLPFAPFVLGYIPVDATGRPTRVAYRLTHLAPLENGMYCPAITVGDRVVPITSDSFGSVAFIYPKEEPKDTSNIEGLMEHLRRYYYNHPFIVYDPKKGLTTVPLSEIFTGQFEGYILCGLWNAEEVRAVEVGKGPIQLTQYLTGYPLVTARANLFRLEPGRRIGFIRVKDGDDGGVEASCRVSRYPIGVIHFVLGQHVLTAELYRSDGQMELSCKVNLEEYPRRQMFYELQPL